MRRATYIFIIALSVIVLSWFLPWLYSFALPDAGREPFVEYSPISGNLVLSQVNDGELQIVELVGDSGVVERTQLQRDSLVPQQYYTLLLARNALPDTICGKPVSAHVLSSATYMFRSNAYDVNAKRPSVYMMMESMPERLDLEDPVEVFRLDGKVEFVVMATNEVNVNRSNRFTKLFEERGFQYPLKDFSANITSQKNYDEGYLMVDAAGSVFHVKQRAGRPYMVKINTPSNFVASKVFIMEQMDDSDLGFVVDESHNLYIIEMPGYNLVRLPVDSVDPTTQNIMIRSNLFNKMVRLADASGSRWYAFDTDTYELLGKYTYNQPQSCLSEISKYIFPYQLDFVSGYDSYFFPRFSDLSWKAIFLNILLAIVFVVVARHRNKYPIIGVVVTLVFGIYVFIPLLLFRD